jgi:hypothetical protein
MRDEAVPCLSKALLEPMSPITDPGQQWNSLSNHHGLPPSTLFRMSHFWKYPNTQTLFVYPKSRCIDVYWLTPLSTTMEHLNPFLAQIAV